MKKTVTNLGIELKKQPFNLNLKSKFYKHCKELKKLTKQKKYIYKKDLFDKLLHWKETDPKQYWEVLNTLKKGEKNDNILEVEDNFQKLTEHFQMQGKCENYNIDFKNRIENYVQQYKKSLKDNLVTDKPFTVSEVKLCINKLKMNKSAGPDRVCNEIIKHSSVVTCKSIVKLFNLILDSGKYPSDWRKSFIILIHKSGEKHDLNNYRGISLQNCIAKLFSSALNQRLISHYDNLFANQQFGFRTNHRTADSLFVLKTLISKYIIKKKTKIYACFVDLRRAFDTVWHTGFLYKLLKNEVGIKFFTIIQDMYDVCMSAVKIDNKYSDYFNVNMGVKQGDSLSPTIFNCFVNDLHDIFDNSCDPLCLDQTHISSLSFADDLVIFSNTHTGLQNAMNKFKNYCFDWQLTVNTNKTKIMTFQKMFSQTPKIFYDNKPLIEVSEYNFLGTVIDYKGNFKRCCQELTKKGLKVLFSLRKLFSNFQHLPVNLSCKLFDTLIRPVLNYNSEIWYMDDYLPTYRAILRAEKNNKFCDILSFDNKTSYEKIHTKFCKIILGLKKTACNFSAILELGRLPLSSFIKTQVMMYFTRLNTNKINPLVIESLKVNKILHNDGIYTWYTFASNIFKEFELDIENYKNFDKSFKQIKSSMKKQFNKVVKENYENQFRKKLSAITDDSKLFLFSKIKQNIGIENYLLQISSFKNRQNFTKFRTSDHCLYIETGRYKNIPRQQRLCNRCNILEDEYHFFLNCEINKEPRSDLFSVINDNHPLFQNMSSLEKIQFLLNPNLDLLPAICTFIKQSLELR